MFGTIIPAPHGVPRILLLHDPGAFRHLPNGAAALTLSGHTHGGQLGLVSFGLSWTIIGAFGVPDHGYWGKGENRLYVNRATAHLAQAGPEKNGSEVYRTLLEKRPDDRRSHLAYVNFLIENGQRTAAAQHLEQTLEGGFEDPALWETLLRLRIQAGQSAKARDAYNRLAEAFPDAFATRVAKARISLNRGRDALPQLRELTEERTRAPSCSGCWRSPSCEPGTSARRAAPSTRH